MIYEHYFQKCSYKTMKDSDWKLGIAKVTGFDVSDVLFILDTDGNKVKNVYDYELALPSHFGGITIGI